MWQFEDDSHGLILEGFSTFIKVLDELEVDGFVFDEYLLDLF